MGIVGAANRGTLFLDEIGELPLELQTRLLRVLQSGEFNRVGSTQPEFADIRFIAATNRNLERDVEDGRFRNDLYYRLSAITLNVPALRERPADIPLLATHFLRAFANRWSRAPMNLSAQALEALAAYSFPGNVRELENEMGRLVAMSTGESVVEADILNERIHARARSQSQPVKPPGPHTAQPMSLDEMERSHIMAVLQDLGGNRTRAAKVLGISREGLSGKMKRLGLTEHEEA
jgi:DNA-binding NtrC family response regulator